MRLNKAIRAAVIDASIERAGIPARRRELAERWSAFAEACRVRALGGQEAAEKIDAIARRFEGDTEGVAKDVAMPPFRTDVRIGVNVGGLRGYPPLAGRRITPRVCTLSATDPLAGEFTAIERLREQLDTEEDGLRQGVRAAVDSCTTVEKLLKVWPEAKELLPEESAPPPALPAIPVAELNAKIGLPTED